VNKESKSRQERSKKIEELHERFAQMQGGVLTDYRGLDVAQISDLRNKFREENVSYQVVKNTLTVKAVAGSDYDGLSEYLKGPTAIAFSVDDAIIAAKIAIDFSKDNEKLEIKGGFMDGQVLSAVEISELSKLGGKDQLLSQVLSVLNSPSQKMLGVFNAVPQKFLGVLKAKEDKEQGL
jgi:large subunit ribosomal protein L10